MIDLMTHLFRLKTILEEGSMRRAAVRLNVTQPALTRSIAIAEQRLGQPLLIRHARGVEPTVFGQEVLSAVKRLSRHWELAEQDLMSAKVEAKHVLRIDAGPLWRMGVLPKVLGRLLERHPGLRVELGNQRSSKSVERLIEGQVDVLFGGLQKAHEWPASLQYRAYTHFHNRVVAREGHPLFDILEKKGHILPKVLLDFPWLTVTGNSVYELEIVHAVTERLGQEPDIRIHCESLSSAIRVLQNSNFISILADGAVENTVNPAILAVPVALGRRSAPSGIIYRAEMSDWPPLEDLCAECERYFQSTKRVEA